VPGRRLMQDGGFFPGSYRFRTFINNAISEIDGRVEVERAEARTFISNARTELDRRVEAERAEARAFISNTRADITRRVEVVRAEARAVRTRVQQAAVRVFERLRALFRPRQPVLDGFINRDSAVNNSQPEISVRDRLVARIRAIINQQAATGQ